jgi:Phasin protein
MNAMMLFDIQRRQVEAMQNLLSASLSGAERAQQSMLSTFRRVMSQQFETAGRVSERAASVALDPEQVRPAMTGIIEAQRDLMSAMTETQRRVMEAITPEDFGGNGGASAYFETVRQSIDQWQRWTEQVLRTAREQTDRIAGEVEQRTREVSEATAQATRNIASQQHETAKKAEEAGEATTRRIAEQAKSATR